MSNMEQRLGPGMLYEGPSLEPGIVRTYPDGLMWLIKPDGTRCLIPCAGGGGGGAPVDAEYVVLALNGTLTAERVLAAGDALALTDGGAGGNALLDVLVDGTTIQVNGLNQLEVIGGSGAPTNAQYVTMALDASLTDERVLTAGDGLDLTDGGAGGNALLDVLVDGVSIGFNGSNELEILGGGLTTAVIKNPLTSIRNTITGTGNVINLPIVGEAGQTVDLFNAATSGSIPFFRLFPNETVGVGAGTFNPATYEGFNSIFVFSRNPLVAGGGPAIMPGAGVVSIPFRVDTQVSPTANTSTVQNFHTKIIYDTAFTSPTVTAAYLEASFRGTKAAASGAQVVLLIGKSVLTDQRTGSTGDITTMQGMLSDVRGRGTGTIDAMEGVRTSLVLSNGNPPITTALRGSHSVIAVGSAGTAIPGVRGFEVTMSGSRAITLSSGFRVGALGGAGTVEARAVDIVNVSAAATTSYALYSEGGQSLLQSGLATVVPLTLRGFTAQTADLQRWQNVTPTTLLAVGATGYIEMLEQTDPAAPAANQARLYSRDNGSGLTQLLVRWPSGNTTVIAEDW